MRPNLAYVLLLPLTTRSESEEENGPPASAKDRFPGSVSMAWKRKRQVHLFLLCLLP